MSVSLSPSPCGVVCCVVMCGVCCVFVCGCWLCTWWWWSVRCGTLKNPCVDSKRLRVYIQNVPVYAGNTRTCVSTCASGAGTRGRIERTHGDVSSGHTGSSPVLLTKKSPRTKRNERILPTFLSLRIGRQQHVRDSSNRSLYLTKLFNSSSPEGNCGGNQLRDGSICLSHLLASSDTNGDGGREKTLYHRKGR